MGNREFAIRIVGQAMVARLVVSARPVDGGVVLCHMEINRPRAQRARERLHGLVQAVGVRPIPIGRQNGVFRGVVAQDIKERVGHIRLKTQRLWPVHPLQEVHHPLPTVHAAPADFPFRRQTLAEILGDRARLGEGLGDLGLVGLGIRGPVRHAARRVNAHHTVGSNAQFAQFAGNAAGLADLSHKSPAFLVAAHGRAAAGGPPNRRDDGADHKPFRPHLVRQALQAVVVNVNADVRVEEKQVHALELDAIHFRPGGQLEHGIEVQARFGARAAFAHQAGPHGVVKFWIVAVTVLCAHKIVL